MEEPKWEDEEAGRSSGREEAGNPGKQVVCREVQKCTAKAELKSEAERA